MSEMLELINKSSTILVLTHESPDGDAIGSAMAMYQVLKNMNKTVDIVIPEIPETFMFLDDIHEIQKKSDKEYDLSIVLDCATKERIGEINKEYSRCKKSIVIDHHMSNNGYGTICHVEPNTPACCQVLYYLFKNE